MDDETRARLERRLARLQRELGLTPSGEQQIAGSYDAIEVDVDDERGKKRTASQLQAEALRSTMQPQRDGYWSPR